MVGDPRALAALDESRELLERLPAADLGKLASTILPAIQVGEAQSWSYILLALIRHELIRRERDD